MSAEPIPAASSIRVAVVQLETTGPRPGAGARAFVAELVAELSRNAMRVEVGGAELLAAAPVAPVYVIALGPEAAGRAPAVVAWAATATPRPGLIGLVDDGGAAAAEVVLAAGFDDAAAIPGSPRELAARVRAVHRRVHWKGASHGRLRFGELTLDLYGRALWIRGEIIAVTSIELAVVRELIQARGRPLSRTALLERAWGADDLDISERAVDNVILRLRRKLPTPELIETVRSVGFRLGGG